MVTEQMLHCLSTSDLSYQRVATWAASLMLASRVIVASVARTTLAHVRRCCCLTSAITDDIIKSSSVSMIFAVQPVSMISAVQPVRERPGARDYVPLGPAQLIERLVGDPELFTLLNYHIEFDLSVHAVLTDRGS